MSTYEEKALAYAKEMSLTKEANAKLIGMSYLADAIMKGSKKLAKSLDRLSEVVDGISLEVQEVDE